MMNPVHAPTPMSEISVPKAQSTSLASRLDAEISTAFREMEMLAHALTPYTSDEERDVPRADIHAHDPAVSPISRELMAAIDRIHFLSESLKELGRRVDRGVVE